MKLIVAAVLLASSILVAQTPPTGRTSSLASQASHNQVMPKIPNIPDANPELLQLVIQDQWDRGFDMFGDREIQPPEMNGMSVEARDEQRQTAVRKLLSEGKVKSGSDFWFSALIFQHSAKPEGIMLAHILAATAAAKGNSNGKWLSAASLDRYLWETNQPQVFGTQLKTDAEGKWTMEPYARKTLSDSERALWCVVPLAQQEKILKDFRDGKPLAPTEIFGCK